MGRSLNKQYGPAKGPTPQITEGIQEGAALSAAWLFVDALLLDKGNLGSLPQVLRRVALFVPPLVALSSVLVAPEGIRVVGNAIRSGPRPEALAAALYESALAQPDQGYCHEQNEK